jgi:hypothetical protein
MVVIHVQVNFFFIEIIILDGGYKINILIKKLKMQLGLLKPNPAPYNLRMADQTITRPLGLIKDFKILVHGIPYIITFTMI